jgi:hypothetical protein
MRGFSSKRNIDLIRKIDLILIRHAESTNNTLHNSIQTLPIPDWKNKRQADCDLSFRGKEQIKYLNQFTQNGGWGNLLPSSPVYYSSPMKRCLETMNAITSSCSSTSSSTISDPSPPQVNVISNLYEFGGCYRIEDDKVVTLPGLTKSEIETNYSNFLCGPGLFLHSFSLPFSLLIAISLCLCLSPQRWLKVGTINLIARPEMNSKRGLYMSPTGSGLF